MTNLLENLLVMVLTVVVLVGGFYGLLVLLDWWLKFKSGSREQEGLANLWLAVKQDRQSGASPPSPHKDERTLDAGFPDTAE